MNREESHTSEPRPIVSRRKIQKKVCNGGSLPLAGEIGIGVVRYAVQLKFDLTSKTKISRGLA